MTEINEVYLVKIQIVLLIIQLGAEVSYGELRRATESFEEPLLVNHIEIHISLKYDHKRAIESSGELRRAMESYGEPWVKH